MSRGRSKALLFTASLTSVLVSCAWMITVLAAVSIACCISADPLCCVVVVVVIVVIVVDVVIVIGLVRHGTLVLVPRASYCWQ